MTERLGCEHCRHSAHVPAYARLWCVLMAKPAARRCVLFTYEPGTQ